MQVIVVLCHELCITVSHYSLGLFDIITNTMITENLGLLPEGPAPFARTPRARVNAHEKPPSLPDTGSRPLPLTGLAPSSLEVKNTFG